MDIRRGLMKALEEFLLVLLIYFAIAVTVVSAAMVSQSEATDRRESVEEVGSPPPGPPKGPATATITAATAVTLDVGHGRNLPLLF